MTRDEARRAIARQIDRQGLRRAVMDEAFAALGEVREYEGGPDLVRIAREAIDNIREVRQVYSEDEPGVLRDEIERATESAYDALEDVLAALRKEVEA